MAEDEGSNSNGSGGDGSTEHPLHVVMDINDWARAGRRILKVVEGLGRIVPPADRGKAAELSQLIGRVDEQLADHADVWETFIRPRLKKYEGALPPALTFL